MLNRHLIILVALYYFKRKKKNLNLKGKGNHALRILDNEHILSLIN